MEDFDRHRVGMTTRASLFLVPYRHVEPSGAPPIAEMNGSLILRWQVSVHSVSHNDSLNHSKRKWPIGRGPLSACPYFPLGHF